MKLVNAIIIISLLCTFSTVFSDEEPASAFYAGLAEIIESNINNPDKCIREAEEFIKKNEKLINELKTATQKARQDAQTQQYQNMSKEEMKKKMEESMAVLSQSKLMESITRFTEALQNFSANNPEYGEKLGEMLEEKLSP